MWDELSMIIVNVTVNFLDDSFHKFPGIYVALGAGT
jgi:hypothetical protein